MSIDGVNGVQKISRRTFAIAGIAVVVLALVIWQLLGTTTSANPLSEADAKKLVEDIYNGEIMDTSKKADQYHLTVQLKSGVYIILVDRNTGDIGGITKATEQKENHTEQEQTIVNDEEQREDNDSALAENNTPGHRLISEKEVMKMILQEEKGHVTRLERKREGTETIYFAVVRHNNNKTTYKIDATTGEIIEKQSHRKKQSSTGYPTNIISEQKAIQLALQQVSGEVDDVDLEREDGLIFYLVEIERNDDQEAIVQINAITGETMSITWDD